MNTIRFRRWDRALCCTLLLGLTCGIVFGADQDHQPSLEAVWVGTLQVGAVKLRLVFDIKKNVDGTLVATMDSPDQSAFGLKIDNVLREKDSVVLESKRLNGRFEGKFGKEGKDIAGQWKQGGQTFPLVLSPGEKATALKRPQEPERPFPYDEIDVTYENEIGKAKFAGTLTCPRGTGPFPAVLLITGSGSQNRDEEILGHKPFLILSDWLTRRGVAVLRVDDRGVGGSTGEVANATTDDFVGDTLAGIEFLRTRTEIDHAQIGLIGHSEGANIAVEIAAKSDRVAYIVLLAPTAVPGDELLLKQAELIASAAGATDEAIEQNRVLQAGLFAAVMPDVDRATAEANIEKFLVEWKKTLPAAAAISNATNDGVLKAELQRVLSPWFRRFLRHDPRTDVEHVRCPLLALFGERDLQVAPSQNRSPLEVALKTSGHKDHDIRVFSSLNHLFQTSKTGMPSEYSSIEETINPEVLTVISDWVLKHSDRR